MLWSLWKVVRLFNFASLHQELFCSEIRMPNWTLELSKEWDVLGPFPINAREQQFLSPSFPLDLSAPYVHQQDRTWSSSYADGGQVGWSRFNATDDGIISVSFPGIRWNTLRATEGWAVLQHHNVLHTRLKIIPPSMAVSLHQLPYLAFSLARGSFLTLIPTDTTLLKESFTAEWHPGNIYEIPRSPRQLVTLPCLSLTQPTTYDLFVSGDYEIRIFGDPLVSGHSDPILYISIDTTIEHPNDAVELDPALDVSCDFVDGWAFGTALGVGLRAMTGSWDVLHVSTSQDVPFTVSLLYEQHLIPTQSRIVPVKLTHHTNLPFHGDKITLNFKLFHAPDSRYFEITTSLKIRQRPLWSAESYEALKATYFLGGTPILYLALPPLDVIIGQPGPPLLALHGAGVDIEDAFWPASLPRQPHSWIIFPTGLTSWGFDWHGPSADDVWASLDALTRFLASSTRWAAWLISKNTRVVIVGHSNGGQGTWHLAARYPDRILAAIPAAAYIKAQQYIPLSLSRGYHFLDPALRSILDASLTPDDNDLFLSNVVDMRILAVHGGDDENVPTWHSREMVGLVKSWKQSANISFFEDPGKPHWYSEIFMSPRVKSFLSAVLQSATAASSVNKNFTLTVATPRDSGSLHGLRIEELEIPGRLGRLHVIETGGFVTVKTTNVHTFSIRLEHRSRNLSVDGKDIPLQIQCTTAWIQREGDSWKVLIELPEIRPSGTLPQIMRSPSPLLIIVPEGHRQSHSIGKRIAHAMLLYFRRDAEIVTDAMALKKNDPYLAERDLVIIDSSNAFGREVLRGGPRIIVPNEEGFTVHDKEFNEDSLGVLFLHPHPVTPRRVCLVMWGTDGSGLERAVRLLLPIRTGITLPEFILIGSESDARGVGGLMGAGFWNRTWGWSETMSWLY